MADQSTATGGGLRAGIVGCGVIAATHIPYIRKAGAELVGIADMSLVQANDLADRFSVQRIHRTVEDLIEAESPDVVHVLTPPHTHADVATAALERGVHVLVEKPMALDVADAERMVEAARRTGKILTVDHNRLFDPVMLEARRLVDSGALGDIVAIESYQAGSASDRSWLARLPGGGLGDLVPHPLYLQLAFLGPDRELHASAFGTVAEAGGTPAELRVLMRGVDRSGVLTFSRGARAKLKSVY
ncbi:MAG: Gfo/Idh/MocA family oxidoreductase, partial [Candidatus Binatia bacterium]